MEDENRRLKLLVAELSLHSEALKAAIRKTVGACRSERGGGVRVGRVSVLCFPVAHGCVGLGRWKHGHNEDPCSAVYGGEATDC